MRFSILVPSYNRPEYIRKTLSSIFASTIDDFEVLISDDNSPKADLIKQTISEFSKDLRLKFFFQRGNLKEPNNKNFLVSKAKGEYLIFIGDDDLLLPNALEILSSYIKKYPNTSLFTFGYTVIDELDNCIYSRYSPIELNISVNNTKLLNEFFAGGIVPFWFFHPATFCCKRNVEKSIDYRDNIGIGEDFMFLFDLVNQRHEIKVIPHSLFKWRKVQDIKNTSLQKNQSLINGANIFTRVKMLESLESQNLIPKVRSIIDTKKHRTDFLYKPILLDESRLEVGKLLSKEKADELNMISGNNLLFKSKIENIYRYLKITGIQGILYLAKVIISQIRYKF